MSKLMTPQMGVEHTCLNSIATGMRVSKQYSAFISYNHNDEKVAKWLLRKLESYTTPSKLIGVNGQFGSVPRKIGKVFRDRDELASSGNLSDTVQKALENSSALIVICSPNAANSEWVNKEITTFRGLGRSNQIFSFIVAGEPQSEDKSVDCFPPALLAPDADSDIPIEPLAADYRDKGDGKDRAFLKLVAGLLGVGYDDLVKRNEQRRLKRLTGIVFSSIAGMVLTSVLAANAIIARDDAQRRQKQAEDIVGFMLGDLRLRLDTVGRLDLMEAVDTKATEYFATLNPRDLSNTALEAQARSLTQIGEVKLELGNNDQAMQAFSEAHARSSALYKRDTHNNSRLFDLSQAEYWLGYAAWQQGRLDDAEKWLTKYRDSTILLAKKEPNNFDYQLESAYGYQNLAVLDKTKGNYARAQSAMNEVKSLYAGWLQQDPSNIELRYELANAASWLGSLAQAQGDLSLADVLFDEQRALIKQNKDQQPTNIEWLEIHVDALKHSALIKFYLGDESSAQQLISEALDISQILYTQDSENLFWLVGLGDSHWKHYLYHNKQDTHKLKNAIMLMEQAFTKNPENTRVRHFLAGLYIDKSSAELVRNNVKMALSNISQANQLMAEFDIKNIDNDIRLTKANLYIVKGQIKQLSGATNEAKNTWMSALALFPNLNSPDLTFIHLPKLHQVLLLLENQEQAQKVAEKLLRAGYKTSKGKENDRPNR